MDDPGNIAIWNEPHTRPYGAGLRDQFSMARTIQDTGCDLFNRHALRFRQGFDVVFWFVVQFHHTFRISTANGDLLHINIRRMKQATALGRGHHGQGVLHGLGGECGAFQRIKSDIHFRTIARSYLLADIEHGGFIALAFTDHNGAVKFDGVQRFAHGIHSRLISGLFIAPPHKMRCGNGGGFRYPRHLHR